MQKNKLTLKDELTKFLLYTTPSNIIKIEIVMHNESVWLPQKRMAELFGVQRPAITKHLKNIFESGELEEDAVSSILEHTAEDSDMEDKYSIRKVGKTDFSSKPMKILKG